VESIRNFIANLSIKTKFIFFTIIASILPIIVLGGYAYISSINNIENHMSSQSITAMDRVSAFLDTYIQQIYNYSDNLAINNNIINVLSRKSLGIPPSDSDANLVNYNISLLDKNLTIPIQAIIIANDGSYFNDFECDSAKVGSGVKTILQQSWYRLFYKFDTKIQFIGG
jgi:hypothetical protein